MELLSDFFSRALLLPEAVPAALLGASPEAHREGAGGALAISGEVEDRKGTITQIENIRIEGEPVLSGTMGEASIEIEFVKSSKISLRSDEGSLTAEAIMKDGQKVVTKVDEKQTLCGTAAFGNFTIPLEKVAHISFESDQTIC
jgi:hypothetical protein